MALQDADRMSAMGIGMLEDTANSYKYVPGPVRVYYINSTPNFSTDLKAAIAIDYKTGKQYRHAETSGTTWYFTSAAT
ncbi:MAG: hypothetical protein ABIH23_32250 [bacterium]